MKTATTNHPATEALLAHQSETAKQRKQLAATRRAIATNEATILQGEAGRLDVAQLQRQCDDLRAEQATAAKGDLPAQIAAAEKAISDATATNTKIEAELRAARSALAGLRRREEAEQAALDELAKAHFRLLNAHLLAEAEAEGRAYAARARDLAESYKRLQAISQMMQRTAADAGQTPRPLQRHGPSLVIPAFELESVAPHALPGTLAASLFRADSVLSGHWPDWMAAEQTRQRAAGVELG